MFEDGAHLNFESDARDEGRRINPNERRKFTNEMNGAITEVGDAESLPLIAAVLLDDGGVLSNGFHRAIDVGRERNDYPTCEQVRRLRCRSLVLLVAQLP